MRFITTYNDQHHVIKKILAKHWHLLTSDAIVTNYVPSAPAITFRKSRSFKDHLTSSHFEHVTLNSNTGTVPCGACNYCENLDTRSSLILPDGTTWRSRSLVSCKTKGIIYLINCPWGAFYVGVTKREFSRRIYEHLYASGIGYYKSPIGRHIALEHAYSPTHLTFVPLAHVPQNPRVGNWEKSLLQEETRWIHRLKASTPPGLNETISFKPFL